MRHTNAPRSITGPELTAGLTHSLQLGVHPNIYPDLMVGLGSFGKLGFRERDIYFVDLGLVRTEI